MYTGNPYYLRSEEIGELLGGHALSSEIRGLVGGRGGLRLRERAVSRCGTCTRGKRRREKMNEE